MISAEDIKNIRVLAFNGAETGNFDFTYRKICRWYSREFSTPLPEVEAMAAESVLQAYFEDTYANLFSSTEKDAEESIEAEREEILRMASGKAEQMEAEDDAWVAEMERQIKEDEEKRKAQQNPNLNVEDSFQLQGEDAPPDYGDNGE